MARIHIYFGTESGNAEMGADDIAEALIVVGHEVQVKSLEDCLIDELLPASPCVFVVSTYGEGEMPQGALDFFSSLTETKPNLEGLRYAAFGLGDSTYKTYNNAICNLVENLNELGASQIGETGLHDAQSGLLLSDVIKPWAAKTFSGL
ncbi:flavodoxin domain-containing protein [Acetobacter persici]|uniref:flavodoxin domain-containing protein n=1 Tax=Acetobacter persici TaxID=1076596 RepID=UPI001F41E6A4|nr:flavodoxin family protein [Acetobacter persici]MCG0999489.1 flavodoxin family protein [Acetobacter persici]